jgi:aerobic carbon-monoxide dehydrogenase medium subunit
MLFSMCRTPACLPAVMKPAEFDYDAPTSLEAAVAALANCPGARVLAGGQSLAPLLARRLVTTPLLIDLRRVPGLDVVTRRDHAIRIGAMVTQREAEQHPLISRSAPLIAHALRHVGHRHTRSLGTIGGSVAYGDPGAELPAVLIALEGTIHVLGPAGPRTIAARDLYLGAFMTSLSVAEIITAIELPVASSQGVGAACVEAAARAEVALAGAVTQLRLDPEGSLSELRIGLFGIADRPIRAAQTERCIIGGEPPATIDALVAEELENECECDSGGARLAGVLARRAVVAALEHASADTQEPNE